IDDARGPLAVRENTKAAWQGIQQATALLAPEPAVEPPLANASQTALVKNDTQGAPAAGNGPDQNASAPKDNNTAQKIVVVEQPVYRHDFFTLENIVVVVAAASLLVLGIEGALLVRRRWKEGKHP
ncbi:MAG: hypothetical protein V1728_03185, partial [Candidatus Micrarchaeota archaeon]